MGDAFFHIDLDAFFASVEILDHPEYKGKPLIIGTPGPRHVASTCSYEARKYGVHSAMPMTTALRLCPDAICVKGRMKRYSEMSRSVMGIIKAFAPGFLQVSIDEAFLDLTGMERIYPLPGKAARLLKDEIRNETGLTVSIGVAASRFVAKLASDYRKPDGLTIVPHGKEEAFVDAIGLRKLWGIGESTYQSLMRKGLTTPQLIRRRSEEELQRMLGTSTGSYIFKAVRGIDPGIYQGEAKERSISTEKTFYPDLLGMDAIDSYLLEMSQELSLRALKEKVIPRTIGIKIRYGDFSTFNAQTTPDEAIYSSSDIFKHAEALLKKVYNNQGVRLLGLTLAQVYEGENVEQMELFREKSEKERLIEKAILDINTKNKDIKIVKAGTMKKKE